MKIGVVLFVTDVSLSPAALARKSESLGFESIFMPEHTVIPVDRKTPYLWGTGGEHGEDEMPDYYWHLPDPFIALALAAAVTTRIKLGTGICLVPEFGIAAVPDRMSCHLQPLLLISWRCHT